MTTSIKQNTKEEREDQRPVSFPFHLSSFSLFLSSNIQKKASDDKLAVKQNKEVISNHIHHNRSGISFFRSLFFFALPLFFFFPVSSFFFFSFSFFCLLIQKKASDNKLAIKQNKEIISNHVQTNRNGIHQAKKESIAEAKAVNQGKMDLGDQKHIAGEEIKTKEKKDNIKEKADLTQKNQ